MIIFNNIFIIIPITIILLNNHIYYSYTYLTDISTSQALLVLSHHYKLSSKNQLEMIDNFDQLVKYHEWKCSRFHSRHIPMYLYAYSDHFIIWWVHTNLKPHKVAFIYYVVHIDSTYPELPSQPDVSYQHVWVKSLKYTLYMLFVSYYGPLHYASSIYDLFCMSYHFPNYLYFHVLYFRLYLKTFLYFLCPLSISIQTNVVNLSICMY